MIKHKEGKCLDCQKVTKLTAGRCQHCYWRHRKTITQSKTKEKNSQSKKKIYTIPKLSIKRRAENVLYLKKRRIFMEQNTKCKARLTGCTYFSTDLHHIRGRIGRLLTDESNFMALCRNCHQIIENNPEFAKENKFSESRLSLNGIRK